MFTKLTLYNTYHLVRIRGGECKAAFRVPLGHVEDLVMPFDPTNVPTIVQALMNDALRDFLNDFVFVYLNEILIYSKDPP